MKRQAIMALSPKVAIVVGIGLAYLLLYIFVFSSNAVVAPPTSPLKQPTVVAKAPPAPTISTGAAQIARNPFSIPAEYREDKQQETKSEAVSHNEVTGFAVLPNNTENAYKQQPERLTGVSVNGIASDDSGNYLAVLSDGSKARAYRVGERIKGYRIEDITTGTVVFSGPAGREYLPMANQVNQVTKGSTNERKETK